MAYTRYVTSVGDEDFVKFAVKLCSCSKRENILKDACSILSKNFSDFDSTPYLFNCKNGTYNLQIGEL